VSEQGKDVCVSCIKELIIKLQPREREREYKCQRVVETKLVVESL